MPATSQTVRGRKWTAESGWSVKYSDKIDVFQKHQILLPPNSHFTKLVFLNEHEMTLHGGQQLTHTTQILAIEREEYSTESNEAVR